MPSRPYSLRAADSEVELKLSLSADAMRRIEASRVLEEHAAGPAVTRRLHSTYFDTAEFGLGRRRGSLRVRRIGRRRIQTLKTASDGRHAVSVRGEWENEIVGDEPDLAAFGRRALEAAGLSASAVLLPVFATVVRRRFLAVQWPLPDGATADIEVAFDRGRIEAGGRREAICEMELELRHGPAAALLDLAAALRALVPLRIFQFEKSARGYRLATGRPTGVVKAASPRVAGADVEGMLVAVLRHCLAQAVGNEAVAAAEGSAESIHQLRVSLRRLRSALSLFRDVVPPAACERWSGEARGLLAALGPCRDLDVFAGELLPPVVEAVASPALTLLAELAAERRTRALAGLTATLRQQETADFLLGLGVWTERRGWRDDAAAGVAQVLKEPAAAFAVRVLDRRRRKLRKVGKGFAGLDADHRHRVRINAKKLRYGLDFFADLLPRGRVRGDLAALALLQDRMGRANDIAVARRLVEGLVEGPAGTEAQRLAAAEGGGQVVGWYARAALDLEPRVLAAWHSAKARTRRPYGD